MVASIAWTGGNSATKNNGGGEAGALNMTGSSSGGITTNLLRVCTLVLSSSVPVTTPTAPTWNLLNQDSNFAGMTIATYWRIHMTGDSWSCRPTWSGTANLPLAVIGGGYFINYDPQDPIGYYDTTGGTGTALTGPVLTPGREGSAAVWWFASHQIASASSRPVALPSELTPLTTIGQTPATLGNGSTSIGTTGVNMNYGYTLDPQVGVATTAPVATVGTSRPWRACGAVIRPAPGREAAQFIPMARS